MSNDNRDERLSDLLELERQYNADDWAKVPETDPEVDTSDDEGDNNPETDPGDITITVMLEGRGYLWPMVCKLFDLLVHGRTGLSFSLVDEEFDEFTGLAGGGASEDPVDLK